MDEHEKRLRERHDRFHYAFISLAFATLALSIQYSPAMGTECAWYIIVSWICFGLSGVFGGLYVIFSNAFHRSHLDTCRLPAAKANMKEWNRVFGNLFIAQLVLFLTGLALSGTFASVNLLHRALNTQICDRATAPSSKLPNK